MEEKVIRQPGGGVPCIVMPLYEPSENGVRLLDMWPILMRRKKVLFGMMFVVLVSAVVYAMLATPVYRADTRLVPPQLSQLDGLSGQGFLPKDVFGAFLQNLTSESLRRQYFDQQGLKSRLDPAGGMSAQDVFERLFSNRLIVKRDRRDRNVVHVDFEGNDANLVAKAVNGFVDLAAKKTVQQLVQNARSKVQSKETSLINKIAVKRKAALQVRQDKTAKLKAAISVAEQLGIKDIVALPGRSKNSGTVSHQVGETTSFPLYMMGYKALKAEVNMLRHRKDDDAYIQGLRDLQEHLALLQHEKFDPSQISAVQIDQAAVAPDHHIRPRRRLIVSLGLIGGLIIGMLTAFFADAVTRARLSRQTVE